MIYNHQALIFGGGSGEYLSFGHPITGKVVRHRQPGNDSEIWSMNSFESNFFAVGRGCGEINVMHYPDDLYATLSSIDEDEKKENGGKQSKTKKDPENLGITTVGYMKESTSFLNALAFHKPSRCLISGSGNSDIRLFKIGKQLDIHRKLSKTGNDQILPAKRSRFGRFFSSSKKIQTKKGVRIKSYHTLNDHDQKLRTIKVLNTTQIASASEDNTARIFDIVKLKCLHVLRHSTDVQDLDIWHEKNMMVTTTTGGDLSIFDTRTPTSDPKVVRPGASSLFGCVFRRSRNEILTGCWYGPYTVYLVDMKMFQTRLSMVVHTSTVRRLVDYPNLKVSAGRDMWSSCSDDGELKVWMSSDEGATYDMKHKFVSKERETGKGKSTGWGSGIYTQNHIYDDSVLMRIYGGEKLARQDLDERISFLMSEIYVEWCPENEKRDRKIVLGGYNELTYFSFLES